MKIGELSDKLYKLLNIESFSEDASLNGLQVGDREREVKKVAFAVDACLSTFEKAAREKADLLIVHHGLFWGQSFALTDANYSRIKTLVDNNLALFACHLPLDAHPTLGNNAQMAKKLGMKDLVPFGEYHGYYTGFGGKLPKPMSNSEIIKKLGVRTDGTHDVFCFGKKKNSTLAIDSGGASGSTGEAISSKYDAFILGEFLHQSYHYAEEEKLNIIGLGHYETETFGVKAVMEYVSKKYKLETVFIDNPTGL